jgi:hypothetical protein
MNKLSLSALLFAIVSATVGVPGYVAAAGCDPASGCCGTGPTYVGQQLFPNSARPFQVNVGPAANPTQPMKATNVISSVKKARAAQTQTTPMVPGAPKVPGRSREALTLSCSPMFGAPW